MKLISSRISNLKCHTSNVQELICHISYTFPNCFDCSTNGTNHRLFSGTAHLRNDMCQSSFRNIFLVAENQPQTKISLSQKCCNHDSILSGG